VQNNAEFIAGEPGKRIGRPHAGTQPLRHHTDKLIREIEAIGAIDPAEIVDAEEQKAKLVRFRAV
jgi:hypothetical protein